MSKSKLRYVAFDHTKVTDPIGYLSKWAKTDGAAGVYKFQILREAKKIALRDVQYGFLPIVWLLIDDIPMWPIEGDGGDKDVQKA